MFNKKKYYILILALVFALFFMNASAATGPASETERDRIPRKEFAALLERNPDVIGRISILGTNVDYPVLHDGTHFYLDHDIDRRAIISAAIYMDPANSLERDDYNRLLHGHHMKNGTMFRDIVKYKTARFFDEHRLIRFDTLYDYMLWEVFSVYVLDADREGMTTDYMGNDELYVQMLNGYAERSMFKIEGLSLNAWDRILTLSTCSYETSNSRTIVHARLINKNGIQVAAPTVVLYD